MPSGSPAPAPATSFVGRAAELARVHELLGSSRLVSVTGPPGVGKSRLAVEVCHELAEQVQVVWIDLAPLRDPAQAPAELSRVGDSVHDPDQLVVLDNCEHLILDGDGDVTSAVADLLARRPKVRILATSRERLHLSAERELPLPPLPMPSAADVGDLDLLRRNPSVAMLLDRSPAAVTLTPGSARALADICIGLDGLPLALELAAARLRVFTPSELAFRLERRMALLTSSPRDAPARHRDLRTAIAWSHDLLPEPERAVFRRLSVFPGEWTLDGAEAVCGEPDLLGVLESLLDKNLVHRAGTGDVARFTMLMSLREYAAERLEQQGDGPMARDQHAAWFASRARDWEAAVGTEQETSAWPLLGRFRADLRAALDHAIAGEDTERTVWLAAALSWLCYTRGVLAEAVAPLEVLTTALASTRVGPDARPAGSLAAGVVSYGLGDQESAERFLRSVVAPGEDATGRRPTVARAFLGHAAREQGDLDRAAQLYLEARTAYEHLGNTRGTAWAGHDLALLALERGDDSGAEVLLRESLRLFESIEYDWAIAVCASLLASVAVRRGGPPDVDEAATLLGRALALHELVGDRRGVAQSLETLAEVALARGSAATAARLLGASTLRVTRWRATPTEAESRHLTDLGARLERILGALPPTMSDMPEDDAGRRGARAGGPGHRGREAVGSRGRRADLPAAGGGRAGRRGAHEPADRQGARDQREDNRDPCPQPDVAAGRAQPSRRRGVGGHPGTRAARPHRGFPLWPWRRSLVDIG